jgi:prepilin-type N-terminal cleavage/methylation domain-containing protein
MMHHTLRALAYRTQGGFTIVELLVTLVVSSLCAATALLAVRLPLRQAELEIAISQIQSIDANARARTTRGQRVVLHLLPAQREIALMTSTDTVLASLQAPPHAEILRIMVHGQGVVESACEVNYERGTSPTFAVLFGSRSKGHCWMLICGISGEVYRFNKDQGDLIVTNLQNQTRNVSD